MNSDNRSVLEKPDAERFVTHINTSIRELSISLAALESINPSESYDKMKRAIGLSIGNLDLALSEEIFQVYPELDPVKPEN